MIVSPACERRANAPIFSRCFRISIRYRLRYTGQFSGTPPLPYAAACSSLVGPRSGSHASHVSSAFAIPRGRYRETSRRWPSSGVVRVVPLFGFDRHRSESYAAALVRDCQGRDGEELHEDDGDEDPAERGLDRLVSQRPLHH